MACKFGNFAAFMNHHPGLREFMRDMESSAEAFPEEFSHCGARAFAGCGGGPGFFARSAARDFFQQRRISFHETDEAYFAFVKTHGLSRESLKVEVSDGKLKIFKLVSEDPDAAQGSKDAATGHLLGTWDLPDDAVLDGIYAKLENNELFISILRTHKPEPLEVPIEGSQPRRDVPMEDAWVNVAGSEADDKGKEAPAPVEPEVQREIERQLAEMKALAGESDSD